MYGLSIVNTHVKNGVYTRRQKKYKKSYYYQKENLFIEEKYDEFKAYE